MEEKITIGYKKIISKDIFYKEHYHNGYEMIFINEGNSNFDIASNKFIASKGSIIFINDLEKHKMHPEITPYSRYAIIIKSDFVDNFIDNNRLLSIFKMRSGDFIPHFKIEEKYKKKIIHILDQLISIEEKKEEFWEIEFMTLFTNLLIYLYRNYKNYFPLNDNININHQILDIQTYIDQNFKNNIGLESISQLYYINKFHLAHSFKNTTGFTVKQYILLKRLSFAKNKLYYSNESITSIALESGFNSQSNFIRLFKKKEATTPLQFRKYYRNNSK